MPEHSEKAHEHGHVRRFRPGPLPGMRLYARERMGNGSWDNPRWIHVADAPLMRPDDFVLALLAGETPYVMPWWVMKTHHVLNFDVEDEPYMIDLCEACSTATAFLPVVNGRRLHFDVVGDYNGTFIVGDRETGSMWQPFMGVALYGELEGAQLQPRPIVQTTWSEWTADYPGGYVLDGAGHSREGHGAGLYPGTFENNSLFKSALLHNDRLPPQELVLGVAAPPYSAAYPLSTLSNDGGVHNVMAGELPVVLFAQPGGLAAIAYSRALDGDVLEFAAQGGRILDEPTGSTWTIWGKATDGPLAGASLQFVQSYIEEWYAWYTTHPATELIVS